MQEKIGWHSSVAAPGDSNPIDATGSYMMTSTFASAIEESTVEAICLPVVRPVVRPLARGFVVSVRGVRESFKHLYLRNVFRYFNETWHLCHTRYRVDLTPMTFSKSRGQRSRSCHEHVDSVSSLLTCFINSFRWIWLKLFSVELFRVRMNTAGRFACKWYVTSSDVRAYDR